MRHFGVPSALTTGSPALVMSAVNAVYQKICCATSPCAGTGPDSENVMPIACGGAYFFIQSMYLVSANTAAGELVAPPRVDRRADRRALVGRNADAPLVDRHAVRDALVGGAGHRQPRVGEAPAERRILLAVVHVAVDALAVELLHVVAEEGGDVLVRAPVHRHAELVAVLLSETAPAGPCARTSRRGTSRGWRTAGRAAGTACCPAR